MWGLRIKKDLDETQPYGQFGEVGAGPFTELENPRDGRLRLGSNQQ